MIDWKERSRAQTSSIIERVEADTISSRYAEAKALASLVREQMVEDRKELEAIADAWMKKRGRTS